MCLITFAINVNDDYPFILIANRDEFYERPTLPAHQWEGMDIIAGKDLKANGTWMGVSNKGRFAAVTNFRDPFNIRDDARSRGDLPLAYLKSSISDESYMEEIQQRSKEYNGFNLLTMSNGALFHFSNYENKINRFDSGIHGLSNALMNTSWPKVERIKQEFKKAISRNLDHDTLFGILADENLAEDHELPSTGLPFEWEKKLSAICIRSENYGTCCSSIVTIDKNNHMTFVEKTYAVGDRIEDIRTFKLKIE